ncbi:egg peptide speract receptor-like isoform X2 [Halichondria panicea]|uniref:egg peptide speract receptor-like isoform X2 n=1 Tax=Halichondria panicea TaxID=6063 RepID=UPI00312BA258
MASICLVLLTIVLVGQIFADGQVCNNGTVKLSERNDNLARRYVQYCHDEEWHWLCAGGGSWTRVEANVVCRQLGLSGQGAIKNNSTLTVNGLYFMFAESSCDGGESNIRECRESIYSPTCANDNIGWVVCQSASCTDGTVRLVGGSTIREGRVDFCTQGHWASICYNKVLADTVCNMLGFPMQGAMAKSTTSSIDPKVNCTVTDDGTTLNCVDTIQSHICDMASLVIKCQTHNSAVPTLAINGTCPSPPNNTLDCPSPPNNTLDCNCNPAIPSSSPPSITTPACTDTQSNPLGAVIGLLVLLEVGTVIVWVACTVTRKRNSSYMYRYNTSQVQELSTIQQQLNNPVDNVSMEPNNAYSSSGPLYEQIVNGNEQDHTAVS